MRRFNLKPEDKKKYVGEEKPLLDKLTIDIEKDQNQSDDTVAFDEVFYKEFEYDPVARSYSLIHHLVFLENEEKPVIDEPWKGQKFENNQLIGSKIYPIRVLTVSYITDEAIPPSDTAIGRPQVNELNKSRTQMILQRDRNLPIRWFDVNRVDPAIQHSLMRGTWQAMIPVQGQGTNIIGEVAKSATPQENFLFDQVAKADLTEIWSIGPNQLGSGADIETKGEGQTVESNYQTRLGRERAKVAKFFVSIAEVLGGLMILYEDPTSFGEGFDPVAATQFLCYSILADSTVLLDSNQRLERLINFVNFGGKSGWVNIEPVMREIASLTGLDPNTVITPPEPKPPVEPNISLRLTGTEDLTNPLTLAFLLKSGQAPDASLIEQAKELIRQVVVPAPPPPPPVMEKGPDGSTKMVAAPQPEAQAPALQGYQITLEPAVPPGQAGQLDPNLLAQLGIQVLPDGQMVGPDGQPIDPMMVQQMAGEMGILPPPLAESAPPSPAPPQVGDANPRWSAMPQVNKRTESGQGGTNKK